MDDEQIRSKLEALASNIETGRLDQRIIAFYSWRHTHDVEHLLEYIYDKPAGAYPGRGQMGHGPPPQDFCFILSKSRFRDRSASFAKNPKVLPSKKFLPPP